jgi:hypothetical protein
MTRIYRRGTRVHSAMGVRRSGIIVAPLPRSEWTDGTYRWPHSYERTQAVWVRWDDGTAGWTYQGSLNCWTEWLARH